MDKGDKMANYNRYSTPTFGFLLSFPWNKNWKNDFVGIFFFMYGLLVVASFGDYKVFLCYKVEDDIDDTWNDPDQRWDRTKRWYGVGQTQTA